MAHIQNQLSDQTIKQAKDFANKWGIPDHDQKHLFNILKNHLAYTDDIDSLGFDSIANDGITLYKDNADKEIAKMDLFSYKNALRTAVLDLADQIK